MTTAQPNGADAAEATTEATAPATAAPTVTATDAAGTEPQTLTKEQQIQALRAVHTFLSDFDRVPGALAAQWSQAQDAIGLVANSLIAEGAASSTTE